MEYVASLSYGKDSIYMLEIIYQNKLPLDRIVHAEIWATDTIEADLPPMVEFKHKAKKIIENRYGIEVEPLRSRWTYEAKFYKLRESSKIKENKCKIYGFPMIKGAWCTSDLKRAVLNKIDRSNYKYIGYAMDEARQERQVKLQRYLKNDKSNVIYPLVDYSITEQEAFEWCKNNNLLSPIYKTSRRGGCWFCHCQSVNELRLLRKNYPGYWELMLKWDKDSPTTWAAKRTLHDYEERFQLEERGLIPTDNTFRWKTIKLIRW